ncbi:MAG TPA: hypothetical protein VF595_07760 [Tepidisphaeraceae bacterium]
MLTTIAGKANAALVIESATRPDFAMHLWQVRSYDRFNNRPSEVGGNSGDMTSFTALDWDLNYSYNYTQVVNDPCDTNGDRCHKSHRCGSRSASVTVHTFKINGRQKTTVFLPNDAPQLLKDHEQAHWRLNCYAYDQAFYKSRVYARRMLRRSFTAETPEQAHAAIRDAFNHEYREPYARWRDDLHKALNDLDGNGRGPGHGTVQSLPPRHQATRVKPLSANG